MTMLPSTSNGAWDFIETAIFSGDPKGAITIPVFGRSSLKEAQLPKLLIYKNFRPLSSYISLIPVNECGRLGKTRKSCYFFEAELPMNLMIPKT